MNVVRTLLVTGAVFVFALVPSAQATMVNLVPNPGFEEFGCGNAALTSICAWSPGSSSIIGPGTLKPHSGSAYLGLTGFNGMAEATSDLAYCMPIGPGRHAASFWYRTPSTGSADTNVAFVGLSVNFWTSPKCTGPAGSSELGEPPVLDSKWHEAAGDVVAPPGTASVSFGLAAWTACDACSVVSAEFDDLVVEAQPLPPVAAANAG